MTASEDLVQVCCAGDAAGIPMDDVKAAFDYIGANSHEFTGELQTHLKLSGFALLIAVGLCFPLGVIASRNRVFSLYAVNFVGVARAIPSIAILFLAYPYLGLGFRPALLALTVLACPPILINTNVGFRGVDASIREAAYGMGMKGWQVLSQVEFPLALPVVIAGLRIATVATIAIATIAAKIGAGGLGTLLFDGVSNGYTSEIQVGAIAVSSLAIAADILLRLLDRLLPASKARATR